MIIDFNTTIGDFPEGKKVRSHDILKLMDRAGIDKAVVSTPGTYSDSEENTFLHNETKNHRDRLIPFGVLNPKSVKDDSQFQSICDYGFPGIKFSPLSQGYFPAQCIKLNDVLAWINRENKIVSITTGVTTLGDPAQWLSYIKKWPEIKFVLLGMGAFDFGYGCVDYAVQFPNVYLETSLQYEIQILKKAINKLEAGRVLFGSDMPVKIPEIEILKIKVANFSAQEYNNVMHAGAQSLLAL